MNVGDHATSSQTSRRSDLARLQQNFLHPAPRNNASNQTKIAKQKNMTLHIRTGTREVDAGYIL